MYKLIKNMSWYKYVALFGKKRSKETRGKADRRREASARGQGVPCTSPTPTPSLDLALVSPSRKSTQKQNSDFE